MLNPAFASHERRPRTRVCHADAPAPLGSRERASHGCPHQRCGPLPPNFCNRQGLRHPLYPTRPLRLTSAAIAPASTFCMRLCPVSRTDLPALPDSSPAPRSEPHCNILPPYCSAAGPGSETRQPEPLASHALLHGVRSCTSCPELPPVAYQIGTLHPTPFGGLQRPCSVEAAELKTSPLLRAESALSYSDHSTRNESAAAEKLHVALKASVSPLVCV